MQLVELGDDGLAQRGDGDGLFQAHRHVADAELERREMRMRADVPPDLLRVVDAVGADQQVDIVFEFATSCDKVGNVGARELVEDFAAVRLQAGVHAQPERRVGGERQDVRQEVARAVHDLDGRLAVLDADVHVQSENQVGARDHLQVFHDDAVALVGIDLLLVPLRERMRAAGGECAARSARARPMIWRRMSRISSLRLLDVLADAGADLDDRLVHLGLDALVQQHPALCRRSRPECASADRGYSGSMVWYSSSMPIVRLGRAATS